MSLTNEELNYDEVNRDPELDYHALNAKLNLVGEDGKLQMDADKEATRQFFLQHVNQNTVFFHSLEEKLDFLIDNGYYEEDVIEQYSTDFVKAMFKKAYAYHFRFKSFLGAFKYYSSYTLKTFDGKRYLERYEDRVTIVALYLGRGDEKLAESALEEIMEGRYQPATPTFLNAGKAQRGELVSCFPYDTLIDTINGQRKIGEIAVGDLVLTHDGTYRKVEKTIENPNSEKLFSIRHYGTKNPINSTPNHPVLIWTDREVESLIDGDGADVENGFVWVEAQDVFPGDYVVATFPAGVKNRSFYVNSDFYKVINGRMVYEVASVGFIEETPEKVYNLEVEDNHTYSVGGVVVHNCFLLRVEDSMESISRAIQSSLQLSKRGGGVALNLTNLREEGAPIKNIENQSSGIVPVMKLLEDSFSYANQLGARQGAGAVYLNVHHPDVMRFLDTKRENADEKIRIKTLSLGLVIPDVTFELAKKNEDMYLFSPYDVERVYGKPFSDISVTELYYEMVENPKIRKKKINARKLFQTIAEIQFESGYPYIVFEDEVNRANPIEGRVSMSNLCVTGDTRINTTLGYKTIEELYETQEKFQIVADNRAKLQDKDAFGVSVLPSTKVFKTAENADVFRLTTREGYSIDATEWHKMYVQRGDTVEKIDLRDVEIGDKILVQSAEGTFGENHHPDLAYLAGVWAADGTFSAHSARLGIHAVSGKEKYMERIEGSIANVLSGRNDLVERQSVLNPTFNKQEKVSFISSAPLKKVFAENGIVHANKVSIPDFVWSGDKQTQQAFLDGYLSFDGTVFSSNDNVSVQVGSTSRRFLQDIQILLSNFGIYTRLYSTKKSGTALLPDGNGGLTEYNVNETWSLRASTRTDADALIAMVDWKDEVKRKYQEASAGRSSDKKNYSTHKYLATVVSVDYLGTQDVYDVTVEDGHSLVFNGIATGNCSEILQVSTPSSYNEDGSYAHIGKDISCNLGSLNIANAFDSPDFSKTIETSIRALTAVSDLSNIRSVPSIENGNNLSHAIGLGQMNLHGFLAREHMHYDSPEALDFAQMYFYTVMFEAIKASNKIAKERKETFHNFENSKYASGEFFQKYIDEDWSQPKTDRVKELLTKSTLHVPTQEDWKKLAKDVKKYGMYNQNLQAIPPTGSISYLANSTASIHPITSPIEIRKEGKIGRVYYPAPYLSEDTLPYYRDAYKVGPEAIIDMYAVATQFVDQGLSLTLFYPHDVTTRDLNKSYIYAKKKGIKTLYYARIRQVALDGTQVEGTAAGYCEACQL